ncbi:tetratricopeptide repeat protein [Pannus brasiliensis]
MKAYSSSRRWLSVGLIVMLFALVSFSMMPLLTSILQTTRSESGVSVSAALQQELESRATGYQMVLEREPDNPNALRGLLETRLQQGDLRKAIEPLEKLARLNPRTSDYLLLLAQAKQQVGDYEGAIGDYRALLASDPGDTRALQGFTGLLTSQNRSIEAISVIKDTLDRARRATANPDDPAGAIDVVSVELLLGKLYFDRKDYTEAIQVYDRAGELDKNDFRPLLGKAIVLREQGKTAEAQPLFQEALARAPVQYREDIKTLATPKPPANPPANNAPNSGQPSAVNK